MIRTQEWGYQRTWHQKWACSFDARSSKLKNPCLLIRVRMPWTMKKRKAMVMVMGCQKKGAEGPRLRAVKTETVTMTKRPKPLAAYDSGILIFSDAFLCYQLYIEVPGYWK